MDQCKASSIRPLCFCMWQPGRFVNVELRNTGPSISVSLNVCSDDFGHQGRHTISNRVFWRGPAILNFKGV